MIKKKNPSDKLSSEYVCVCCQKVFSYESGTPYTQGWFNINAMELTMVCSVQCLKKKRKKHKFNATPCQADDIHFSSKAERAYYNRLKLLQSTGAVIFFLRQVPFSLPGNTKYVVDFQVFYSDGTVAFVDVKGVSTPMFILKKKQVEALYPIIIEVVQ